LGHPRLHSQKDEVGVNYGGQARVYKKEDEAIIYLDKTKSLAVAGLFVLSTESTILTKSSCAIIKFQRLLLGGICG